MSSRNGIDRHHSTAGSMLESGLHNSAFVGDNNDSNDVIMMMATTPNAEEKRSINAKRRIVPSIYKVLQLLK